MPVPRPGLDAEDDTASIGEGGRKQSRDQGVVLGRCCRLCKIDLALPEQKRGAAAR